VDKNFRKIALSIGIILCSLSHSWAQEIFLPNTGVNSLGNLAPLGSLDTHYQVTAPGVQAFVVNDQLVGGAWVQNPTSQWIWINPQAAGLGTYTFRQFFTLTASDLANGVSISGEYAADDSADVYLNGGSTSLGSGLGFGTFATFSGTSGFVVGTNFIDFAVFNNPLGGNPGGLNVKELCLMVATAPEPGTLGLLALGVLGGLGAHRRGGAAR
jgi:PEP-CTERM motif